MTFNVGSSLPDFDAQSNHGPLRFSRWLDGRWALVVAFQSLSPTCSTEFVALQALHAEFERGGARVLAVSIDAEARVAGWLDDLRDLFGCSPSFTIVNDASGAVPEALDLLDPSAPALLRTAYLVSPDQRVVMALTCPVTNGRNFAEILRMLKAVQLTTAQRVATPADWADGAPVMLPPSLAQTAAETMYPAGVKVLRPYLRLVAQPEQRTPSTAPSSKPESN